MIATIEHIIRITDDASGQVLESVKSERIEITNLVYRHKKYDIQFRYVQTGRGDMAMGLKEVKAEEKENAEVKL